ncbi:hypothetical protein Psta_0770 [Pirellula staleyi DSM 6068]|uniref:Uncharacterized protein n=1 Tax=Pirellula staleyi (strain ATCC 27377 / DSM 6068 / ICPB 4128) TaxID=530564 RepID=D2R677_PIRSD|nr:hypothetical protein [Pirellula staleyi]ADB15455.1 hypothetical protein Psta_0770 [Pirellula staleyi DSM 6068]
MLNFQWWDYALLAIGSYVAVVSLVKLMQHRRTVLITQLSAEAAEELERKRKAERKAKKKQAAGAKGKSS